MRPGRNKNKEPNAIDVYLDESTDTVLKTLHCMGCGFVLMQYYNRAHLIIAATAIRHQDFNRLPDKIIKGPKKKAPNILQCHNSKCRLRYNIR